MYKKQKNNSILHFFKNIVKNVLDFSKMTIFLHYLIRLQKS